MPDATEIATQYRCQLCVAEGEGRSATVGHHYSYRGQQGMVTTIHKIEIVMPLCQRHHTEVHGKHKRGVATEYKHLDPMRLDGEVTVRYENTLLQMMVEWGADVDAVLTGEFGQADASMFLMLYDPDGSDTDWLDWRVEQPSVDQPGQDPLWAADSDRSEPTTDS